ncbi:S-layer homology domain-containing protein, partial [uncultured Megasphaera sp.]|uniref:S-layer homology domain-containing protein n=1 Tax=uncultured Megasphaera sp. TaxID=165188 RepID=UPI0025EB1259
TTGNTVINNNGLTVGGKTYVTNNGINANNQTITNVASGGNTTTNAANIGDVQTAVNNAVTNVTNTLTAKGLDFEGNDGAANKVHRDLGTKLTVKGGLADVTTGVSGKNLGVKKNAAGDGLDLVMSEKPEFKEVTAGTGTNKVVINDNGVHVGGKTYINNSGLNANNQKITNVATGTAGTDAVNVDQLNAAIGGTAKATTVKAKDANVTVTEGTNAAGGKEFTVGLGNVVTVGQTHPVTVNGDAGTVNGLTNTTWDIDNPTVVHGQAATEDQLKTVSDGVKTNKTNITNINNTIAKGLNFGGDSGTVINKKLGEKLEIKGGASADLTDDNIGVVSDGTKLNVKLKKDVNLGSDGSLTVNGKTYVNKDGLNANNQKITNVATGTAGTDAVNVDQLNAAIAGTAKATTVKAKDANVTVTEGTNPAGGKEYTVGLGDKVTLGTADKKIVADGTSGKITAGSKVTIDGTTGDIQAGTVKVTGAGTVNELTNRTWDIDNPTVVHGQAATEDQLKTVSDGVKTNKTNITNINNTIAKGLNFGGDSGTVINKKLGEKLEIKGGASADLTDDNIGVVSDGTKLNVKLKKDVNLGPDGSLTVNGKTYVNKDGLNANGQKITNVANGTANSDAVNFGQLKDAVAAGKTILKDGKNTTVEGEGTVANPYKVNVNDDLVLGKKGADGKDGSIGVNGKDGSSVVIHGKDGISIKGKDGKDGVTLKAKDGANGTEGQIGLTGPAGKDGKSTHADIGVNAGPASLDPAKNLSATEMTRLYYVDEKGDHQVATMDDGMKFAGNTGLAIKKLNSTMTIRGTGTKADTEYDPSNIKTMVDADGNMIVGLDKNLKADSVGINGKDGRDGATIKGGDGKPGVDGTNITRLIIEEKNGKQHDIATLDDGMKYGGDTGAVIKKKLNGQVNVIGGISDESKLTTDDNIGVVSDGSNNLKARLAKDLKGLNSVTAGNVVMDTTGFYVKKMTRTPAGTVSLTADGLNNGGNKIANIAAGEADTDAVNVSQLKNQGSEIVNKGFGIKAEDGNEVKKKLGETVDVVGDGKNISTRVEGGRVRVGLKDDILLNSVTTGRTRMDTNGLTVQDGSGNTAVTVDKDGLKIKDGPSVTKSGIDAGGKKITNVAAGEADTDAVNVSQLKKAAASATTKVADGKNTTVTSETNADGSKTYHVNLNDDITLGTDPSKQISIKGTEGTIKAGQVTVNGTAGTVNGLTNKTWDPNHITSGQAATEDQLKVVSGQAGKHSSVTEGSNISVTTGTNANGGTDYKVSVVDTPTFKTVTTGNTVMSSSGLTIKNGPSITQTGVDAGGKRITNVAAGKADTDAVNVGQLKQIGGAINKVDNRINRVGAGAAALAALHPLDFDPDDKWDFTLGYGNYKDAHSLALGAFYRPNEDTMISVGGSIGGGENMVNAGLSMKLGQGNHVSTSKVAMAKEIKDLRAELENVKGALLKVADGRPLDSMDMDKMQLFPDVPENHWAYDYVATLAGNGVIVGYPDGQFGGDRMMTRYEMAALIYRAMQNGAAADDRMARALKEFEPELERIRVDTISKHKDGTPDIQRVRVIKGRG